MAAWDDVPEQLRVSNLTHASDIVRKLKMIGWDVVVADEPDAEPVRLSESEVERLAELEHERWVEQRRADGWSAGEVRDVAQKVTPYLVPWELLPEEAREWDREPVREIPTLLANVGLAGRRPSVR